MGDVITDFYKSDAPQFRGRSKEKRREMAIAAKLTAERGPQNESATEKPMSAAELSLQKRKALIDKQITQKRQLALNKAQVEEELSIERRKRAAEIGAKSSSYKTRFAAMKLASGENKPVRGKGNKAAKRAAAMNSEGYGMEGAPSIKDAKPAKKTSVKYDKKMGVMAPQVKEATYPSDFIDKRTGKKKAVASKNPASANASAYNIKRNAGGQRVIDDE